MKLDEKYLAGGEMSDEIKKCLVLLCDLLGRSLEPSIDEKQKI
jgi:hypothetical protein